MHKIILENHFYFENLHQSYELHGTIFLNVAFESVWDIFSPFENVG